jgi:Ca-activated chloride channel family protein
MQANEAQFGLFAKDCYADIGLISAHVSGKLNGVVAQIKVRQTYKNWSDSNIECAYTFPMAWQSVLLGMHVELNGKRLTGSVKPKKVAEAEYEKAIDTGDLPVMLERSGKDIYTANIGNIQTGDEVVVEFVYAQILKVKEGCIRFNLPTTIAPRYGDSDSAGVRPHQQSKADAQAEQRLFLNLELSKNLSAGTIYSPTHEVQVTREESHCIIRLEGAAWLDRDFVLDIDRIGDLNFAVAAPDPARTGEATLLTGSIFRPQNPPKNRPSVIKVLVDCSGSMQGDSIAQARDCLGWLFGQLGSADKVSFTRFGSSVEHDHPSLQACTIVYRQVLKSSVRKLAANLGGTEIDAALKEVIAIRDDESEESRNAVILLITDGEVWNIDETIATVRASGHRIYAIGVGSAPVESLLQEMAEVTGGACEMVTPRESMQKAVERLLARLRQTQAVDHEISCSAPVLWHSHPTKYATQGEALMQWNQIRLQPSEHGSLSVKKSIFPGESCIQCNLEWDPSLELSRIAAAFRLHDLIQAKERETLALEYQLVSSETNLILVHERIEAEKAEDLPDLHQVRPMLAAGWGGNGTAQASRAAPSLQVLRSGVDNVPFLSESVTCMSVGLPAVWRSARTHAAARVDGMSSSGMDDIEIPAFLRKEADGSSSKPRKEVVQRFLDIASEAGNLLHRTESTKTPQASPDELIAILGNKTAKDNPIQEFLKCFNQAALSHTQFRSALATCLRTNQAGYLQWLVSKHMKAAGSGAPIWAVFISWVAEKFLISLDRHAERLLRDFLKSVKAEVQATVRAELDALVQN